MKTFGEVIKEMVDHERVHLVCVNDAITRVVRGNGKKKPSTITLTIAVPDETIDDFFRCNNPYCKPGEQATAYMVWLDRETVNKIARNEL
ncbi:MAG: hypothetical protein H6Q70_493 [Firmicutes bacterium]|nr:hypothetical protein [Bacillota bacterium]